ncbi:hypothetical protein TRFO_13446 [Tritrichomonas foetus]|uniref:Intimal thickness related receptor IRP domain-containing protein n=1 Tax=Tritrichomonas foetus TaxID=1144522 RepID=A0A1J4KZ30_9EUKA|nr:hypothetical protein TRFO_13446 [Tritrichomonas foetus]|eukprot:OHT16120.1 hypothetical protein TRFO_13446 [Tritrichomonas foetus]
MRRFVQIEDFEILVLCIQIDHFLVIGIVFILIVSLIKIMNLFVYLCALCNSISIANYKNQAFLPGTIVKKIFDLNDGSFLSNFTFSECHGTCNLELILYNEADHSSVFEDEYKINPVCCQSNSDNCQPGFLKVKNNAPVMRRVFKIEGSQILNENLNKNKETSNNTKNVDFAVKESSLWTIILSNCGDKEFVINGNASFESTSQIDNRLFYLMVSVIICFIISLLYLFFWSYSVLKSTPTLAFNHKAFIATSSFLLLFFGSFIGFFIFWLLFGDSNIFIALGVSTFRALSIVSLLYMACSCLQYPNEIGFKNFYIIFAFLFIFSFFEVHGITKFNSRLTGTWNLGFSLIPFADFLLIFGVCLFTIIHAFKSAPQEVSDDSKRKKLLIVLSILLLLYTFCGLFICYQSYSLSIIAIRGKEWIEFSILPIFLISLDILCGWYLWDFNPMGWQTINDNNLKKGKHNDNFGLGNDLVQSDPESDPGFIPVIKTKTISKKKRKRSDDGFDFNDEFLDKPQPIPIDNKLD